MRILGKTYISDSLGQLGRGKRKITVPFKISLIMLVAIIALAAVGLDSTSRTIAEAAPPDGGKVFVEDFEWKGNHASKIKGGTATTVWWDENSWDVRTDTSYNGATAAGGKEHMDIHKSVDDLGTAAQDNQYAVGGDGGPGVGIMHVDFESVASSRLRNPMLISADQPGVVEFRTSNFVTTGHWWEVAITPTDIVTPGEFTAVPSPGDPFGAHPGAGHRPAEDSINYISLGSTDVPCISGWFMKNGVTKFINGVTEDFFGPNIPTDPSLKDVLFSWRLEYYPDKIKAFVDLDRDGVRELHNTIMVDIPWSEVYVALMAVGYQAHHHPQDGDCGAYQGQVREISWKEVRVSPVKYNRTASYPKNEGTVHVPQNTGWMFYDMRDTQRFGPADANPPQANEESYNMHTHNAFCQGSGFRCPNSVSSKTLSFDLPAQDASGITRAQLVYDIKRDGGGNLTVNGVNIGSFTKKSTVRGSMGQEEMWAQRSIDVDPSIFVAGQNTITIDLQGEVAFDRLSFDFAYGEPDDTAPLNPIGLNVVAVSDSQIDLNWTASSDPESGVTRYDVYRGGVLVGDTSGTKYSDMGLDENTLYAYEVVAINGAGMKSGPSNSASATTLSDVTPPIVVSASASNATTVAVKFSEPVDQTSAENSGNYSIGGISVLSASLGADLKTVTLTTSQHADGTYTVTVTNVKDRASSPNTIAASNNQAFYIVTSVLDVTNLSMANYLVRDKFNTGGEIYIDRSYTYGAIPGTLAGSAYIVTSNADKLASQNPFITFDVNQNVIVSVIYDDRLPVPAWLQGFQDTGDNIDIAGNTHSVRSKAFDQGTVSLGGNEGVDSSSMYTVVVTPAGNNSPANQPPTALFSFSPGGGVAPLTVNFDASGSSDSDGSIVSYAWDFGDGSTGSGASISHEFTVAGPYVVELTVTDDDGAADSIQAVINITDQISLSVGNAEVEAAQIVEVPVKLSEAPAGIAGYVMNVSLDSQAAEIVGVNFPAFSITDFAIISPTEAEFRAGDLSGLVAQGAADVLLANLVIRGMSEGTANVQLGVIMLDDRNGGVIEPGLVPGTITVHPAPVLMPTLPGMDTPVNDIDGDGLAEDMNGNGRLDFADLTAFFSNIDSQEVQDNIDLFDFNGDGVVDDGDVITLLDMIIQSQ